LQLFEIRVELEALAVRLATKRITPEQLAELESLTEAYTQIDPQNKRQLIELDSKFHFLIAKASQNKFLHHDIEHYYNLSTRIWYLVMDLTNPEDIDVKAHLNIQEAIEAGMPDIAAEAMTRHIKDFHKTIKGYI
ncbi:MAG: GntR family transcriptional regulator, partial [Chloroflexota bacterium]|nr:GntR family transcriptional regulator [Chloroflexota bacterium]